MGKRQLKGQFFLVKSPKLFFIKILKKAKLTNDINDGNEFSFDSGKIFFLVQLFLREIEKNLKKKRIISFFTKWFEKYKKFSFLIRKSSITNSVFFFKKKKNKDIEKKKIKGFLSDSLKNTRNEIEKGKEINLGIKFSTISFEKIEDLNFKAFNQYRQLEVFLKKAKQKKLINVKFLLFLFFVIFFIGVYWIRFFTKYLSHF